MSANKSSLDQHSSLIAAPAKGTVTFLGNHYSLVVGELIFFVPSQHGSAGTVSMTICGLFTLWNSGRRSDGIKARVLGKPAEGVEHDTTVSIFKWRETE